jgi:2-octaprenylphenol hydroxylase
LGDNGGMNFDIVIVGGGLAGLSLAAALRRSSLSVALVEGQAPAFPEGWDARVYAISPANARFLDELGAWRHLTPRACRPWRRWKCMAIRAAGLISALTAQAPPSWPGSLESSLMARELWETVKRQGNLSLLCPARPRDLMLAPDAAVLTLDDGRQLTARLVVGADGAESWTRSAAGIEVRFDPYDQLGVVANFETELPHRGTAYQWFRCDEGVLAWLPLPGDRMSMVWSAPEYLGRELMGLDAEALCGAGCGGRRAQIGRVERG